ncbi:MAG TPA: hypothetical protein VEQ10_09385, partial [Vicinamibacteria bacterium]|nr:hypothetical protein [Vicinamibacteria bacterium]
MKASATGAVLVAAILSFAGSLPSGTLEPIAPRPSLLETRDTHHAAPPAAASETAPADAAPGGVAAKPLPAAGSVAAGSLKDDPHATTPLA